MALSLRLTRSLKSSITALNLLKSKESVSGGIEPTENAEDRKV